MEALLLVATTGGPRMLARIGDQAGPRASWRDIFDVYAISEFAKAHFYVFCFRQIAGGVHDGLQPRRIDRHQRDVFAGRSLCLNDYFLTGIVDIAYKPKLIDALDAVRRIHFEIDLPVIDWRAESRGPTRHRKVRDNAQCLTLSRKQRSSLR